MEEERVSAVFERKILREIYGPVKENELWRIRRNDELEDIIKGENIVRFIKKPTNTMAWSHRRNAGHSNPQKDVRKAEILTSYIYGPTCCNAESRLFLFAAQRFNTESMQKVILWHSCV
jgi:hypothetical protein